MRLTIIVVPIIAAFFSGCLNKQPLKTSLTEMGTVSETEYGTDRFRLMRAVNITGLSPEEVVGSITINPDKNWFEEWFKRYFVWHNDLPDMMKLHTINSHSSLIIEKSACDNTFVSIQDVQNIHQALQQYQLNISERAKLRLKQAVLKHLSQRLNKNGITSDQQNLVDKIKTIYPDVETNKSNIDITLNNINTALSIVDKNISDNLTKSLLKPGIIIANWERETELSGNATFTKGFNTDANSSKTVGGFVILGLPSMTTLYIGKDIEEINNHLNDTQINFKHKHAFITNFQLRAKYIAYSESVQSVVTASIRAEISSLLNQLKDIEGINLSKISNDIEMEISGAYRAISAASTSGILDGSTYKTTPYSFSFCENSYPKKLTDWIQRSGQSFPIISSRISTDAILKLKQSDQQANIPCAINDFCCIDTSYCITKIKK